MLSKTIRRDDSENESDEGGKKAKTESPASASAPSTSRSPKPTVKRAPARKRKGRAKKSSKTPEPVPAAVDSKNLPYVFNCQVEEEHGQPIYGVQFNHNLKGDEDMMFAAVGTNRITVYECPEAGGIKMRQSYGEPDPAEIFFACAWTYDESKMPLLAAAGSRGVIRIISIESADCLKHFIGHTGAVHDLKFHPREPNVLLSASQDRALRLWNIKSGVCIAIFGAVDGHRDSILTADFNVDGTCFVSGGMDHALKIWRIDTPEMQAAVEKSYSRRSRKQGKSFETVLQRFPDFTTRDVHGNYVDCVKWYNELILSKSCENCIVCWKPGRLEDVGLQGLRDKESTASVLHRFEFEECDIWFMRFSMNYWQDTIALGNQLGNLYVWKLDDEDPEKTTRYELKHPRCTASIRQTSFSPGGSVILSVCDDSTIWRWNRNDVEK